MHVLTPSNPLFAQIAARITAPLSAAPTRASGGAGTTGETETAQFSRAFVGGGSGRAGTLAGALVALRVEVYTAQAQTQVIRVQDEMLGTLIDLAA